MNQRSGRREEKAVNASDTLQLTLDQRGPGGDVWLAVSIQVWSSGRDGGYSNLTVPDVVHKSSVNDSQRNLW